MIPASPRIAGHAEQAPMSTRAVLARVGNNIRVHRELAGLTQQELADRAQVDRVFLSKVEQGTRNSSLLYLTKLARAMDIAASALVHDV